MKPLYETLELQAITQRLSLFAKTPGGQLACRDLAPVFDRTLIRQWNAQTDEMSRLLITNGDLPREGFPAIVEPVDKTRKGGLLSISEGFAIYEHLQGIQRMIHYAQRSSLTSYPLVQEALHHLSPCTELYHTCAKTYTSEGTISDHASSTLHRIRRQLRLVQTEIDETLNQLLRQHSSIMAELYITTRQGRQVLPIKTSHKNALSGAVLGTSDTGLTSYVLPDVIAHRYFRLEQLTQEEAQEIDRILLELSDQVAHHVDELLENEKRVTELDIWAAKAQLAHAMKAIVIPTVDAPSIDLREARHPLIDPTVVVANSYRLTPTSSFILITGPNTGGKTVALKTVGLLVLMHQCGLGVPVKEGSSLGVFSSVMVDIGDEQSIASSLSTFSSHLKRLITITDTATSTSLVLIDEIGAGTDPAEGEGLAVALFERLHSLGAFVMASTHYSNLKTYAKESSYIQIASMEFDENEFKPTYRYLPGIPGKSYAFEISERYGLASDLVQRAREFRLSVASSLQKRLDAVERNERLLVERSDEIATMKQRVIALQNELDQQKLAIEQRLATVDEEVDQLVNEAVEDALSEIDRIVSSIQGKSTDALKMHEWIAAKQDIKRVKRSRQAPSPTVSSDVFVVGDYVRIKSLNQRGPIVAITDQTATVNLGLFTVDAALNDLDRLVQPAAKPTTKVSMGLRVTPKGVPLELNLVGKRIEEADPLLHRYLEDAVLVNHKQVRIIHGHGTGAMRNFVHETLKSSRLVKDFRLGGSGEGGVGATVVTLK